MVHINKALTLSATANQVNALFANTSQVTTPEATVTLAPTTQLSSFNATLLPSITTSQSTTESTVLSSISSVLGDATISNTTATSASATGSFSTIDIVDSLTSNKNSNDRTHQFLVDSVLNVPAGANNQLSFTVPQQFSNFPASPFAVLSSSGDVIGQVSNNGNNFTVQLNNSDVDTVGSFNFLTSLTSAGIAAIPSPQSVEYTFSTDSENFTNAINFVSAADDAVTKNAGFDGTQAWWTLDIPLSVFPGAINMTSFPANGDAYKFNPDVTVEIITARDVFNNAKTSIPFTAFENNSSEDLISIALDQQISGGRAIRITFKAQADASKVSYANSLLAMFPQTGSSNTDVVTDITDVLYALPAANIKKVAASVATFTTAIADLTTAISTETATATVSLNISSSLPLMTTASHSSFPTIVNLTSVIESLGDVTINSSISQFTSFIPVATGSANVTVDAINGLKTVNPTVSSVATVNASSDATLTILSGSSTVATNTSSISTTVRPVFAPHPLLGQGLITVVSGTTVAFSTGLTVVNGSISEFTSFVPVSTLASDNATITSVSAPSATAFTTAINGVTVVESIGAVTVNGSVSVFTSFFPVSTLAATSKTAVTIAVPTSSPTATAVMNGVTVIESIGSVTVNGSVSVFTSFYPVSTMASNWSAITVTKASTQMNTVTCTLSKCLRPNELIESGVTTSASLTTGASVTTLSSSATLDQTVVTKATGVMTTEVITITCTQTQCDAHSTANPGTTIVTVAPQSVTTSSSISSWGSVQVNSQDAEVTTLRTLLGSSVPAIETLNSHNGAATVTTSALSFLALLALLI